MCSISINHPFPHSLTKLTDSLIHYRHIIPIRKKNNVQGSKTVSPIGKPKPIRPIGRQANMFFFLISDLQMTSNDLQ